VDVFPNGLGSARGLEDTQMKAEVNVYVAASGLFFSTCRASCMCYKYRSFSPVEGCGEKQDEREWGAALLLLGLFFYTIFILFCKYLIFMLLI
jgi:hypothetical protein